VPLAETLCGWLMAVYDASPISAVEQCVYTTRPPYLFHWVDVFMALLEEGARMDLK